MWERISVISTLCRHHLGQMIMFFRDFFLFIINTVITQKAERSHFVSKRCLSGACSITKWQDLLLENGFGATEETDQDFGRTDGRRNFWVRTVGNAVICRCRNTKVGVSGCEFDKGKALYKKSKEATTSWNILSVGNQTLGMVNFGVFFFFFQIYFLSNISS